MLVTIPLRKYPFKNFISLIFVGCLKFIVPCQPAVQVRFLVRPFGYSGPVVCFALPFVGSNQLNRAGSVNGGQRFRPHFIINFTFVPDSGQNLLHFANGLSTGQHVEIEKDIGYRLRRYFVAAYVFPKSLVKRK